MDYSKEEEEAFLSQLVCPLPQRTNQEEFFALLLGQSPSSSAQQEDRPSTSTDQTHDDSRKQTSQQEVLSSSIGRTPTPCLKKKPRRISQEDVARISIIQYIFERREELGKDLYSQRRRLRHTLSFSPSPQSGSTSVPPKRLPPLSEQIDFTQQDEIDDSQVLKTT